MPGNTDTAYADASTFVRLLKTESRVRILDVLLGKHYATLDSRQIADLADVDRTTVDRNVGALVEAGVVEQVEADPRRFALAAGNPAVEALREAHVHLQGDHTGLDEDRDLLGPALRADEAGSVPDAPDGTRDRRVREALKARDFASGD